MARETQRLELTTEVRRKHQDLPAYLVVPADRLEPWELEGTTTVRVVVDGHDAGRRSLKRWDDARWFVDLTAAFMGKAGLAVGDRVELELRRASTELPAELRSLLEESAAARRTWEAMTDARRRAVREHVLAARRPGTRARRARRMLELDG